MSFKNIWSEVEAPWWDDRPTIIVGTGGSLKGFDFGRLRGLGHVLAVKEALWDLPFAEACFGLDLPWMKRRREALFGLPIKLYLSVPYDQPEEMMDIAGAAYLRRRRRCDGLSENPGEIEAGGNSGFGAFNLAVLKKAKDIVLFGYDYQGEHYCRERYTHIPVGHNARYLPRWGGNFAPAVPQLKKLGVKVLNASPNSTVEAFEKCSIDQAIERLKAKCSA